VLVVSGRLGFEIVQKAIVAGIPLLASVGAASSIAAGLAERYGLTLATFVAQAASTSTATPPASKNREK
jgi:FdhD protein